MANIKSQIKRNKQNEVRRERNKAVRTALKTSQKKVQAAIAEGDAEAAAAQAREASKALDKAASKGVVHKRTAARRKSRLARAAFVRDFSSERTALLRSRRTSFCRLRFIWLLMLATGVTRSSNA